MKLRFTAQPVSDNGDAITLTLTVSDTRLMSFTDIDCRGFVRPEQFVSDAEHEAFSNYIGGICHKGAYWSNGIIRTLLGRCKLPATRLRGGNCVDNILFQNPWLSFHLTEKSYLTVQVVK